MPPLRVAVVGAGAFGRNHLRVYRELELAHPELVQLTAVVEADATRRADLAAQYGIPAFASVDDLIAATQPGAPHLASEMSVDAASLDHAATQPGAPHLASEMWVDAASLCHAATQPGAPHLASEMSVDAASLDHAAAQPGAPHLASEMWVDTASLCHAANQPGAPHLASEMWVDAASLCVPTIYHAATAAPLLAAGIDILIEKPFAATLAEADSLLSLARKHNRILAVGHLERFNPAVTATLAALNRPMFFEAHRLSIFTPRSLDVDVVLDLMIHDLDVVLALTGSAVKEVRAVGLAVLSPKVDIANVRLEFDSGCVANFTASRVSTEQVRKLRLFQPHQYLSLDFARQELLTINVDPAAAQSSHPSAGLSMQKTDLPRAEPLRLELEDFLHAVRHRTQPRVPGEAGRAALALALEINEQIAGHAHRAGLR